MFVWLTFGIYLWIGTRSQRYWRHVKGITIISTWLRPNREWSTHTHTHRERLKSVVHFFTNSRTSMRIALNWHINRSANAFKHVMVRFQMDLVTKQFAASSRDKCIEWHSRYCNLKWKEEKNDDDGSNYYEWKRMLQLLLEDLLFGITWNATLHCTVSIMHTSLSVMTKMDVFGRWNE